MQTFLTTLRIVLSVFPAVVDLVLAIERAAPLKGMGADKLQLLKEIVGDTYQTIDEDSKKGLSLESIAKAATAITNRLVGFFNKTGWPAANTGLAA